MIEFPVGEASGRGYLALPPAGEGPGVLVLHAWWGLNPFFTQLCDRLAEAGFVAFAPDLNQGQIAATVDEAEALMGQRDFELTAMTALGAASYLRGHTAVRGQAIGVVGFSMGGAWALMLSGERPEDIAAAVIFYGTQAVDFAAARAAYLGHFAEDDEWEPAEGVQHMESDVRAAGREVTFYTYPGTQHWFFESDRPEYNPAAAELAWQRTVDFLRGRLAS